MNKTSFVVKQNDVKILRELAKKKVEIGTGLLMQERIQKWIKHNDLQSEQPMILIEPVYPVMELKCEEEWARGLEYSVKLELYRYNNIKDDEVIDPFIRVNWDIQISDFGVEVKTERGTDEKGGQLGYHWEPPIKDLDKDFGKLKPRTFTVNREKTLEWKQHLESVLGDIIPIEIRAGSAYLFLGITSTLIYLIGLEKFMLYMCDNPEGLHRIMRFLTDDNIAQAKWFEKENLLTLNNANEYVGSGSRGFTNILPQNGWKQGNPVRLKDIWILLESQETVGVSPAMFEEFVGVYQRELAELFGLVYYGCCEPVHGRWKSLKLMKNLRSVSVSPWCDQEIIAQAMGKNYVFSRKPSPAMISTGNFDESAILADLRKTLSITKKYGCITEFIMKDVHNLNGELNRNDRWVALARKAVSEL